MNNLIRYPLLLLLIGAAAAVGVGSVFVLTKKKIDQRQVEEQTLALAKIFGEGAQRTTLNPKAPADDQVMKVHDAQGKVLGYAAIGTARGYSSVIKVMVGVEPEGRRLVSISVLVQQETPGLGSRVEERRSDKTWLKVITGSKDVHEDPRAWFQAQFDKQAVEDVALRGKGQEKGIDAITGATTTSKAVVAAVQDGVEKVRKARQSAGESEGGVAGAPAG